MSADSIIYCLERLSDYRDFERLCSALLANAGYPDIDPLGGTGDEGRDAIIRSDETGRKIGFAYTVRSDWRVKLASDCKRVHDKGHDPDDLDARISAVIAAGWTPVILVASGRRADYLSPYRLPEDGDVPSGFSIRPPERKERGLYATVNGVEVYAVPMSSSRYLVFPKEYLQILRYQVQPGAIGVMVHAKNESRGKCDIWVDFACEFLAMPPGAGDLHT